MRMAHCVRRMNVTIWRLAFDDQAVGGRVSSETHIHLPRSRRRLHQHCGLIVPLLMVVCAACAAPFQRVATVAPPPGPERVPSTIARSVGRPTVGLAFGGGSARGIAHVGVIRWLEEHRIPIDMAVGTSMGGLVGGAFASGMDARSSRRSSRRSTGTRPLAPPPSLTRTFVARPTPVRIHRASSSG